MDGRTSVSLGHIPSLDGLRGIAVAAVVAYHFSPAALPGGFIGVDVFFVLSGFLLTSLLVREFSATGHIRVGRFFVRRTRRLLPAMVMLVSALAVYGATWADAINVAQIRRHGVGALAYAANWLFIADGVTYGDSIVGASPFRHVWSLSIEEQFYIVLVGVVALLAVINRDPAVLRRRIVIGSALLAAVSATWMVVLSVGGASDTRIYFGSDTRAQALLVGVTLGAARVGTPMGASRWSRWTAIAGAAVLGVIGFIAHEDSTWMFRGGFFVTALAAGAVVVCGPSAFARVLERRPLVSLGVISYGVYLWHWPILVVFTESRLGFGGLPRLATLVAMTLVVSSLSYVLVERPIRHGVIGRRLGPRSLVIAPLATLAAAILLLSATFVPAVLGDDRDASDGRLVIGSPIAVDDASGTPATPTIAPSTSTSAPRVADSASMTDQIAPARSERLPPAPTTPSLPSTVPATTIPRTPGPLRVAVLGDSVMHTLIGGQLTGTYEPVDWIPEHSSFAADRIIISNASRSGCSFLPGDVVGLVHDPRCDNWEADLDAALGVGTAAPADALVVLLTNDLGDHTIDGEFVEFASPQYVIELRALADQLRRAAHDVGARLVVLVPAPRLDPDSREPLWDRESLFAAMLGEYVVKYPDVAAIDLGNALCPGGDCASPIGGFDPRWRFDGLHYSLSGSIWMGNWLTPQLESLLGSPPHTP